MPKFVERHVRMDEVTALVAAGWTNAGGSFYENMYLMRFPIPETVTETPAETPAVTPAKGKK